MIRAYLEGLDLTLIVRNLGLTIEERFVQLMQLQRFAAELRRAGAAAAP